MLTCSLSVFPDRRIYPEDAGEELYESCLRRGKRAVVDTPNHIVQGHSRHTTCECHSSRSASQRKAQTNVCATRSAVWQGCGATRERLPRRSGRGRRPFGEGASADVEGSGPKRSPSKSRRRNGGSVPPLSGPKLQNSGSGPGVMTRGPQGVACGSRSGAT